MKTIKAIFTTQHQEMPMGRRYSFNTTLDVEKGDLIESPDYKGKLLQVVTVENKVYLSFSYSKGELFEEVIDQKGYGQIKLLDSRSSIISEDDIKVEITSQSEKDEGF